LEIKDMKKKNKPVKSALRIAIEKNIELAILWGSSFTWSLLFLLLITVYFRAGITQAEIMTAIRYQLIAIAVAICMCPLVQFPLWFRLLVFGTGLFLIEVGVG
jgi:hypothetical protein